MNSHCYPQKLFYFDIGKMLEKTKHTDFLRRKVF